MKDKINGLPEVGRYDDIIHLPHHVSKNHPQMSIKDRAAQFAPFAALTGHGEAIRETARLTEEKREIAEDEKKRLNNKLKEIWGNSDRNRLVKITYFEPDERKSGGKYLSCIGEIKRIDMYQQILVMMDKMEIPIEQIIEIDSDIFTK